MNDDRQHRENNINDSNAESLHTDQHDANVVSSGDDAGRKNDKAGDNSFDKSAKRVYFISKILFMIRISTERYRQIIQSQ